MIARLVIVSLVFLLSAGGIARATKTEQIPIRKSLTGFPMQLGDWNGRNAGAFDQKILAVLGVDDYVNLVYGRTAQAPIGLYVGYYESQRQGDAIHSPLNCLPGAGWEPVSKGDLPIAVSESNASPATRTIVVNRYVIRKGVDQQLVLYWYQSGSRVVASEYTSKVLMVWDAIRRNRTDAALVRVIAPVNPQDPDGEAAAERRASDFVKAMFPVLGEYLPS
jgi:EpsI family protein